jgi:hypothetical protein
VIAIVATMGSIAYLIFYLVMHLNWSEGAWAMTSMAVVMFSSLFVTTRRNDHWLFRRRD